MKVYVASSWRNERQPAVVAALRAAGHEVYDFKHPSPGDDGFHWSEVIPGRTRGPSSEPVTAEQLRAALEHPVARRGFARDMEALDSAAATVLVLPCGRSAHLELGFAVGAGQHTLVLMEEPSEPELMYRMCARVCSTVDEVVERLGRLRALGVGGP